MMNHSEKLSMGKNQPSIDFVRYLKSLWKMKYLILIITTVFSVVWMVIYTLFLSGTSYESSAVIKFDDPRYGRNVGAVTDFAYMGTQSKLAVLRTKSFLGRVVDSLKYNIVFENEEIYPFKLCKKIIIGKNPAFGQYTVVFEMDTLMVTFFNDDEILEESLICKEYFGTKQDPYFSGKGLAIVFNRSELSKFSKVEFVLIPKQVANEALSSIMSTNLDR
jgi:hypothetical protein